MSRILRDIEKDVSFITKEIQKLKIRIAKIPEHNIKDYNMMMGLLSKFRNDKVKLLTSHHSICQDVYYKNELIDMHAEKLRVEIESILEQNSDMTEFQEMFMKAKEAIIEASEKTAKELKEDVKNETTEKQSKKKDN